jgi:hypothetical protein
MPVATVPTVFTRMCCFAYSIARLRVTASRPLLAIIGTAEFIPAIGWPTHRRSDIVRDRPVSERWISSRNRCLRQSGVSDSPTIALFAHGDDPPNDSWYSERRQQRASYGALNFEMLGGSACVYGSPLRTHRCLCGTSFFDCHGTSEYTPPNGNGQKPQDSTTQIMIDVQPRSM